jgi:ribonuclease J
VRACIHRGTKQIGGTCIEVEAEGKRIALDVGLPLGAIDSESELPLVAGFRTVDAEFLALVISHPHQDHYGLAKYLRPEIPVVIGDAAHRILQAAKAFTPSGVVFENTIPLVDRSTITIGPFEITPYLVDHSAYDAYSVLIVAEGKKVFYSGDFRGHGRKSGLFEKLLRDPPKDVDVLMMEGTVIGRTGSETGFPTETDLEAKFAEEFRFTAGISLVWTSGQNIDRLVTIYRACKRSGRQFVIDLYTAEILRASGNTNLPQGTWDGVRVFLPEYQRRLVKRERMFDALGRYKSNRIYPEVLATEASRSVLLFRPSMTTDLERLGGLKGARLVYSLWSGYLREPRLSPFVQWLAHNEIPMTEIHTSGHASISDLKRLAAAIHPKMLVPIHSFETGRFSEFFDRVEMKNDGEWWNIPLRS